MARGAKGPGPAAGGLSVLAVACLVVMLSNGMTLAGLTVFDRDLLAHLGAGRAELKLRDAIQMLSAALAAPFVGWVADRVGVRPLMMLGLLALTAGFSLYPRVSSLTEVYALHALLGVGLAAAGLVLAVSVVAGWFVRGRGLAIGALLAGGSLGNGLLPLLNTALDARFGWQRAMSLIALVPLFLVPAVWAVTRRPPPPAAADASPPSMPDDADRATGLRDDLAGWRTLRASLGTRAFACLAVVAFCTFSSLVGVTAHTFLILTDRGFEPRQAAAGLTVLFAAGLAGKLAAGAASDRLGVRRTLLGCLAVMLLGAALLATAVDRLPWLTLAVLGLGWGGIYTQQQLAATALFAAPLLGRVVGLLVFVDSVGAALGPWALGRIFDSTGSYQPAFLAIFAALLVALAAAVALRLPGRGLKDPRPAPHG